MATDTERKCREMGGEKGEGMREAGGEGLRSREAQKAGQSGERLEGMERDNLALQQRDST